MYLALACRAYLASQPAHTLSLFALWGYKQRLSTTYRKAQQMWACQLITERVGFAPRSTSVTVKPRHSVCLISRPYL